MKKKLLLFSIVMINIITVNAQLTESFDGATFPPAGWLNVHTTGTNASAIWSTAAAGAFLGEDENGDPAMIDPHSGAGMASFSSYDFNAGNAANLISSVIDLTAGGPHLVKFWMYRDNGYTNADSISVYINTSAAPAGASFLGKIIRHKSLAPAETGAAGWYQYSFNIPAGFNTATNYIIFSGVSRFGNNMFIDDVSVEAQPSCLVPTDPVVSDFDYAAGNATATWRVASASAVGYEWALNTTGTAPATGTAVTDTTASITGITSNMVNYLFLRTNCGAGDFSSWISFSFAALPCAILESPIAGATNVPQSTTFSWTAVAGANSYNLYFGTTAGNVTNLGNTTSTAVPLSNLVPLQTYYWYAVPVIAGVAAPNRGCTANSFTVGPEANTPVNNACTGAIAISSTNIAGNEITSTTTNATISVPGSICNGATGVPDDDVWFEFTTSASTPAGTLTITPTANAGLFDIVAQVYEATSCTNLGSPVACADSTIDNDPEVVHLSELAPNTHYFMRVFSWASERADTGSFTITASALNTLPVRLATFTARRSNGVNILNWSTQQELNTSYFVIERSNDGRNFINVGRVAATGNSNVVQNYTFTDIHPAKGINYYRLRTIDKDNSSKLSVTRSIRNEGIADVTLYPNPVKDKLSLNIDADKATDGHLFITDLSGKIIYSRSVKLPQGNTILPVSLNNIAAGSYIMKIQMNDDVIVKKFSKQ